MRESLVYTCVLLLVGADCTNTKMNVVECMCDACCGQSMTQRGERRRFTVSFPHTTHTRFCRRTRKPWCIHHKSVFNPLHLTDPPKGRPMERENKQVPGTLGSKRTLLTLLITVQYGTVPVLYNQHIPNSLGHSSIIELYCSISLPHSVIHLPF